jgi:hypothetical protein
VRPLTSVRLESLRHGSSSAYAGTTSNTAPEDFREPPGENACSVVILPNGSGFIGLNCELKAPHSFRATIIKTVMNKSIQHLIGFSVCVLVLSSASAAPISGSQHIYDSRYTPQYGNAALKDNAGFTGPFGPFGWYINYTMNFDGRRVMNNVQIDFVFDLTLGFTAAQKTAYMANAERRIEGIWNNQYWIADANNNATYPIMFDLSVVGPYAQTVFIGDGPGRASVFSWFDDSSAAIMAHEFGHMLGLFDEYIGGAVNRYPNPTLSRDGLMGLGASQGRFQMYPRYYQQDLDFVRGLNPGQRFRLQAAVPEPSTSALFLIGALALAAYRKKLPYLLFFVGRSK